MNPEISPNGTQLVFYSNRAIDPNGHPINQIYKLNRSNPGNVTRLTNDAASDYDPVFSPDGSKIFYKSNRDDVLGDIWVMDSDGSNPYNITPMRPNTEEWKATPLINSLLVITSRSTQGDPNSDALFLLDTESGQASVQLRSTGLPNWYPSARPGTNNQIAFVTKAQTGEPDSIWWMDVNKPGTVIRITPPSLAGDCDDPSFTPDGNYIVFVNNQNGHYVTCRIKVDGTGFMILDNAPSSDDLSPLIINT